MKPLQALSRQKNRRVFRVIASWRRPRVSPTPGFVLDAAAKNVNCETLKTSKPKNLKTKPTPLTVKGPGKALRSCVSGFWGFGA